MDALITMKLRRLSPAALPNAPLDFAYPLRVRGGEVEGSRMLDEIGDGSGVVLFRLLRLLLAWVRRPVPGAGPFGAAAFDDLAAHVEEVSLPQEVRQAFAAITTEIRAWHAADPRPVSDGCSTVQAWACRAGWGQTGITFGVAAALANPEDPRKAWIAGKLVRDSGQWREGDLWLRRAEGVARWIGDHETQVLALNSRGNLHHFRGASAEAERYLTQALRLARRRGLRARESEVTHDLFIVRMARGAFEEAEELAGRALALYGAEHPILPKLAHDTAQIWLHSEKYDLAIPVLNALSPLIHSPDRPRLLASMARAAGAVRDSETFDGVWDAALSEINTSTTEQHVASHTVLVDLGAGAAYMERWSRATDVLLLAYESAEEREDLYTMKRTQHLLDQVQQRSAAAIPRRLTSRSSADLSRKLVATLSA